MSLLGSIQLANNTLRAADIGLQVVGNNIANAGTPGYTRQEAVLTPAPVQRLGNLLLGMGVKVDGIIQKVDNNLIERLRSASSDSASSDIQKNVYQQLEGLLGELSDTDLSTSLNNFFSSIDEVLNQPESISVRNLAVLKGQTLVSDINRLASRTRDIRADVNKQVADSATDINRLLTNIRDLNLKISEVEGGQISKSDASGLRDQRNNDLASLAKLVDIKVQEQPSGGVSVFASDGDYLVFEGTVRKVYVQNVSDRGQAVSELRLEETNSKLSTNSGAVGGLVTARDDILGGFLDKLDTFAGTLINEFNKVYSSGQGLNGYQSLTSEHPVNQTTQSLDEAGLPFTPVNGSFEIQVYNKRTKLTQTTRITVDLNGLDTDTSLANLQSQLDAVDGVSASLTTDGKLKLSSDSVDQSIAFGNDSSGILAALGFNTFFTGSSALDVGVNTAVAKDPSLFAASKGGIGADTQNGVDLAGFLDKAIGSQSGSTLADMYAQMTGGVTQASSVAASVNTGFQTFEASLSGQAQAISGVNLDEEAIKMIEFQRMYQASAKYIATINDLLEVLVNL